MVSFKNCIFVLLVWSVSGITIYKECIPKSSWEIPWEGSHIDVTFWLREEVINKELKYDDAPLWFQLQFRGTSMPNDYDRIWVSPKSIVVERIRNRKITKTNHTYTEPLQAGWNTLVFAAENLIEVSRQSQRSRISLVTASLDKTIDKIGVTGSNITINCHHLTTIWQVDGENRVAIPLSKSEKEHHLSIFSNLPSRPMIYLASQDGLQLGWDGSNLADQTHYKAELQSPIRPSAVHNITIACTTSGTICDIMVGPSKKKIKSYSGLKDQPRDITFSGAPMDKIFVFSYRQSPNVEDVLEHIAPIEVVEGDSGKGIVIAITVVLAVCLASIIVIAALVFKLHRKTRSRDAFSQAELQQLIHQPKEDDLMQALKRDDKNAFKDLSKGMTNLRHYEISAHYLGRKEIIEYIKEQNANTDQMPSNDIVKEVLNRLNKATTDIFKAAELGIYKGRDGVRSKLEDNQLPGSITDKKGRSILHYMAAFRENGTQIWGDDDIADFLDKQDYYINAVDHQGNTVLHTLAANDSKDDKVAEKLAKVFIDKGADPSVENNTSILPHELADKNAKTRLRDFLKWTKENADQKPRKTDPDRFNDLVQAAANGNTNQIRELLLEGIPLLPMTAEKEPLVEAMRANQRDAVFLLLSAGAPICNRSISDLTALEAAHNTLQLPGCFAAIMRKVSCNRLETEQNTENLPKTLSKIIEMHKKMIKEHGKEADGIESKYNKKDDVENYSKEVRKHLVEASKHGLLLTCLLLAQKDTYLHPQPGEESPFEEANKNRRHDIQMALCRDIDMVPFSHESSKDVHSSLLEDMYQRDIQTLKYSLNLCHRGTSIQQHMDKIHEYDTKLTIDVTSKNLLYMIAKHDLVALLYKIITDVKGFDINQIVEDFTKCAMIHVASMNGSIRVIEYLIKQKASLDKQTIGNFSAAHLAAIGGHKECYHCFKAWMEKRAASSERCNIGLSADELIEKYEDLCKKCDLPLMTHLDALCIKNETQEDAVTYQILMKKGDELSIKNIDDLTTKAELAICKDDDMNVIREKIKEATETLCNVEGFMKGKFVPNGPLIEMTEVLDISHVDFIFEIDDGSQITYQFSEDEETLLVSSHETANDNKLTGKFLDCVKNAIKQYQYKEFITLSPPFLEIKNKGINIRWLWKREDGIKLLTSYIVPTVKREPDQKHNFYDSTSGTWVESSHKDDYEHFSKLGENKKNWLTCRYLRKLTQRCWWSPSFKTQYYSKPWHTWDIGVEGLSETKLKRFFKEESQIDIINMYKKIINSGQLNERERSFVRGIIMYLDYLSPTKSQK